MNSQPNGRDASDFLTMPNRAWLAWYTGQLSTQVLGRIMDVHTSGVSVLVEEAPPIAVDATAWVKMEEPTPTDWAETTVIGITEVTERRLLRRGPVVGHLVHLQFSGDYPYEFFRAATNAAHLNEQPAAARATEAEKLIWR